VTVLVVALVVGVALSLVNPALLLWMALGLLVGVLLGSAPEMLRGFRERRGLSKRELVKRVGLLLAVVACLGVTAFFFFAANPSLNFRQATVVVETSYKGVAKLNDDPTRLVLTETLTITPEATEKAAKEVAKNPEEFRRKVPPPGGDFERALKADIEKALTAQGWTAGPPSTAGREFVRERVNAVELPAVRAQRTISLTLSHPRLQTNPPSRYAIELSPADKSNLTVIAEKDAIGDSYPEGKTEAHLRDKDLEDTVIPLPESGDQVELDVRRPLFREAPFVWIADLTLSKLWVWALGLIFTALGLVLKDEIKAFFKRLLDRLLGRKPAEET
jgi:hypothetical protein